jgi:hypothetical protein
MNGSSTIEFEKFVPVFPMEKSKDERIVCGIVYAPDEEDLQGDGASEEEIRKAAYHFMEHVQRFKVNHKGKHAKVKVLDSYLAPVDLILANRQVKKGTWLLTTRILDDKIWKDIKSGKIAGFSMAGYASLSATKKSSGAKWPSISRRLNFDKTTILPEQNVKSTNKNPFPTLTRHLLESTR